MVETIGLIGGMSWESSLEYYRIINKTVKEQSPVIKTIEIRIGKVISARRVEGTDKNKK